MKTIFKTSRLYLREFTLNDAQLLVDLNSDPLVTQYTEKGPITTIEDAIQRLRSDILPQYINGPGRWAVFLRSNDEFIGWCGVKYIQKENIHTLGYRFFHKHWGKGYATEAAKGSLDYAFDTLNVKCIYAKAMKENRASLHVIKKLGMVYLKDETCANHPAEVYILNRC